jgi:hypothetical protein
LDFRGRLELDSPTISLVDLLLSKLQIQRITEKDIKDMIAILARSYSTSALLGTRP